ncbi:hypothetical protein PoB_002088400 [Plakobranchus ocellatus]|uniref:Mutator-like transposase domain-containing protein n=1 Tax=Plakobranchus ocellatus TaxID=259542 RepID=A0AAV3ZGB2_9GAST|nr:hypothetical protein PoB_002088400 [Plakobranchus ocellatus]
MGSDPFNLFSEYMDLPGLHKKTFLKFAHGFYAKFEEVKKQIFSRAVSVVRAEHAREKGIELMENTVLDICVSYDGTWLKRGHTSQIGIGCVIDVLTGLVLEAELLSTYCHTCETTGTWVKGNTPQRYNASYDEHRADCCINYVGTSGNMEVVAAELLWARSVDNHRLRYTSMLSNGDAKAFVKVQQLDIYPVTRGVLKSYF